MKSMNALTEELVAQPPVLTLHTTPESDSWLYDLSKRVLDIAVSSAVLVISSPVLLIGMLAVRLTSDGPVVFKQKRIGQDGIPFTILKLRTMRVDADHSAQRAYNEAELRGELADDVEEFTLESDPRMTPVGGVLRKYSVDELPQLWNVVRGDMSLVGPRPSCDWEVELFGSRYASRMSVPPGITGLWQVAGRRTIDMRGMLELDVQYAARRSFLLDLMILIRTIPAVLRGTGAS